MINAVHTLIFADDPDAARAFFRDVLGFPAADTGGGWLIFKTGPSELGVHPRGGPGADFDVSLMCDDIETTVAELRAKGAEFEGPVVDRGFGLVIQLKVPGAGLISVYEPKYDPPATSG